MAKTETPRFKLVEPHYTADGEYLERETIVGEGTAWPISERFPVTMGMEGLDDEAEEMVREHREKRLTVDQAFSLAPPKTPASRSQVAEPPAPNKTQAPKDN